jgi:hypothetical protein
VILICRYLKLSIQISKILTTLINIEKHFISEFWQIKMINTTVINGLREHLAELGFASAAEVYRLLCAYACEIATTFLNRGIDEPQRLENFVTALHLEARSERAKELALELKKLGPDELLALPRWCSKPDTDFVSPEVAKQLLPLLGGRSVLILHAEKFGEALLELAAPRRGRRFLLCCDSNDACRFLSAVFSERENINCELMPSGIEAGKSFKAAYDTVICILPAPLDPEAPDDEYTKALAQDFLELRGLVRCGGTLAGMAGSKLLSAEEFKAFREEMAADFTPSFLGLLPAQRADGLKRQMTLLGFVRGRPDLAEVREFGTGDEEPRTLKTLRSAAVPSAQFSNGESWDPHRLLSAGDPDVAAYLASRTPKMALADASQFIFRGRAAGNDEGDGEIRVVNIKDLGEDGEIDCSNLQRVNMPARKALPYMLEDGDLVVTARGTLMRCAVFKKQPFDCIISSNLVAVRGDPRLNLRYLLVFLLSPAGKKLLGQIAQGRGQILLSPKALGTLLVPVPSAETQRRIAAWYQAAHDEYRRRAAEARAAFDRERAAVFEGIY